MRFEDGAAIVRERSAGICEARRPGCSYIGTQTHHRQPRGMGGVDRFGTVVNLPSALVRICLACHNWVESERAAAEVLGLLVRRPTLPGEVMVWLHSVHGTGWYELHDEGTMRWHDLDPPEPVGPVLGGRANGKKSSGPGHYRVA